MTVYNIATLLENECNSIAWLSPAMYARLRASRFSKLESMTTQTLIRKYLLCIPYFSEELNMLH